MQGLPDFFFRRLPVIGQEIGLRSQPARLPFLVSGVHGDVGLAVEGSIFPDPLRGAVIDLSLLLERDWPIPYRLWVEIQYARYLKWWVLGSWRILGDPPSAGDRGSRWARIMANHILRLLRVPSP